MSCRNNGVVLNKRQIEILSRFIKNNKELGMDICSCDVQRVLDMNQPTNDGVLLDKFSIKQPVDEELPVVESSEKKENKIRGIKVHLSVDIDGKKIGELITQHVMDNIKLRTDNNE